MQYESGLKHCFAEGDRFAKAKGFLAQSGEDQAALELGLGFGTLRDWECLFGIEMSGCGFGDLRC